METTPQSMGPVVVVTGAAGEGVGRGVCDALHETGTRLVLVDINHNRLQRASERYPKSLAVPADVRQGVDIAAVFKTAVEHFGRVDALVNSAGVGLAQKAHESSEADFDRLFDLNVRGLWLATRAFARHCIHRGGGGAVVNISSVHAQHTQSGYALYAATKSAVEGLTRGLSTELGPYDIRCNAVAPGAVLEERLAHTYGLPVNDPIAWILRHAQTQQVLSAPVAAIDVGRVVAFLASPASWAISGQTLTVDAGLSTLLYDRTQTGDA